MRFLLAHVVSATEDPVYPTALYIAGACCLYIAAVAAMAALCTRTSSMADSAPTHSSSKPRQETAKWVQAADTRVPQASSNATADPQGLLRNGTTKTAKTPHVMVNAGPGGEGPGGVTSSSHHSTTNNQAHTTESGGVVTACSDSHAGVQPLMHPTDHVVFASDFPKSCSQNTFLQNGNLSQAYKRRIP
jgi:hypothetical protein